MATIEPVEVRGDNNELLKVEWRNIRNGDTILPFKKASKPDKTMHVFGTFGGATVTMTGGNDDRAITDSGNASMLTVKDSLGNNVSLTTAGYAFIIPNFLYWKPAISGAGGDTALTVAMTFV